MTPKCLNCGASLGGPFCSACGQRAVPPGPTVRELAGDAYGELVGWDGKFARTIRLLLTRPGELTRAAIAGQRARHVSAVRLYLMCSVLYFVIQATVPLPDVEGEMRIGFEAGIRSSPDQTAGELALGKAMTRGINTLTPAERADLDREIDSQAWVLRPMLKALAEDFDAVTTRAYEAMPRVLFVLIPALALILRLFYRGRHYPEHLYFATHLGAFVFLVLTLESVVEFTRSLRAIAVAQVIGALMILAYVILAQHRVYGGSWPATVSKAIGVSVIYGALWSLAVFIVTLWAAGVSW